MRRVMRLFLVGAMALGGCFQDRNKSIEQMNVALRPSRLEDRTIRRRQHHMRPARRTSIHDAWGRFRCRFHGWLRRVDVGVVRGVTSLRRIALNAARLSCSSICQGRHFLGGFYR